MKDEDEGDHNTSHILIEKDSSTIFVERTPGIFLASVRSFLSWACKDDAYAKTYTDPETKKEKAICPVLEVEGLEANTIGGALKNGLLEDVEYVAYREESTLDEEPEITDVRYQTTIEVRKKLSEERAAQFFSTLPKFLRGSDAPKKNERLYVRIKSDNGQIKKTEVDLNNTQILEQMFMHNELVKGFASPLEQRYESIRPDMVQKIKEIAARIKEENS